MAKLTFLNPHGPKSQGPLTVECKRGQTILDAAEECGARVGHVATIEMTSAHDAWRATHVTVAIEGVAVFPILDDRVAAHAGLDHRKGGATEQRQQQAEAYARAAYAYPNTSWNLFYGGWGGGHWGGGVSVGMPGYWGGYPYWW